MSHAAYMREWRSRRSDAQLEGVRATKRAWTKKNARSVRATRLKCVYGMTLDQYDQLLKEQGGVCAICREPETVKKYGKVAELAIDHCHDTGEIRGLLCDRCNRGIGLLRDSNLQAAVEYLSPFVGVEPQP